MRRKTDYIMSPENEGTLPDGSRRHRESIHSVPTLIAFGVIAVLLALYYLVYIVDNILPEATMRKDALSNPDIFITENAHHHLKILTEFGPRVAGSYENEVLTVGYLKRVINNIIINADKSQNIELDHQIVTGSFHLNQSPHGKIVPYGNLQNIVVRIHGSSNESTSLLVNSHFDSVPTSPGGSDDGISCAILLEILRIISKRTERLKNNVVILFNGAEETGLQAAHGFITQHKWANDCKVVINLEAAGHGGKMILFQTGPNAPWLLNYYNKVPHPYAQAAGEEIFQSGLIPSDTDFRIFRDFGGLVGLDMAFMKNGYKYHTKYDDFEHLPLGSFQQAGSNALSLITNIANAPELSNPKSNPGKVVFFDFFGLFMISYNQTTAQVVNLIVAALSVIVFGFNLHAFKLGYSKQSFKYLAITLAAVLGGWLAAAASVAIIALFVDQIGFSMSWYSSPWLIFGLYVIPAVGVSASILPFVVQKNLTINIKSQIQAHTVRLIWTVVLFIGSVLNIRSMYAILLPVAFNTVAFFVIYTFRLQHSVRKWQVIYLIFLIIPTMFLMYTSVITLSLFVPICGRIGPDKNADLIIGGISFFFTILIASPFVAVSVLVRKLKYAQIFLALVFLSSFIIIFTPLGFPYNGNVNAPTPQRHWILHSRRIFNGENGTEIKRDAGYFLLNMDRNSPGKIKGIVSDLARAKNIDEDCAQHPVCGLPLIHAKILQILKYSTWIPAGPPIVSEPTTFTLNSQEQLSPTLKRYNVTILGPDRIGVYISPKRGFRIANISFLNTMSLERSQWNGRELCIIISIWAESQRALAFTLDIETPPNFGGITTEIGLSGIYVHDNINRKMPHYQGFLKEFPDWADLTAWLGTYENFWV